MDSIEFQTTQILNNFPQEMEIKEVKEESALKLELDVVQAGHEQQTIGSAEDQLDSKKHPTDHEVSKENIKLIKSFYTNQTDYAAEENKIKCYFCQYSAEEKYDLLSHIKISHLPKITELRCEMTTIDMKDDCPSNEVKKDMNVQGGTSNLNSQEDPRDDSSDIVDEDDDVDEFLHGLLNIKRTTPNVLHNEDLLKKLNEDARFACTLCDKSYKRKNQLESHIQNKHSTTTLPKQSASFVCSYCSDCFTASTSLNTHIKRKHSDERPFKCNTCDRAFVTPFELKIHELIHSGEKPFTCSYCSKTFRLSGSLTKHTRIHTNERPYQCNVCEMSFSNNKNLKSHKRVHKNTESLSCNVCGKIFNNAALLNLHRKNKDHPAEV